MGRARWDVMTPARPTDLDPATLFERSLKADGLLASASEVAALAAETPAQRARMEARLEARYGRAGRAHLGELAETAGEYRAKVARGVYRCRAPRKMHGIPAGGGRPVVVHMPCGDRHECDACRRSWVRDARRIIVEGLGEGRGFALLTLTAPGQDFFGGGGHHRCDRKWWAMRERAMANPARKKSAPAALARTPKRCWCGTVHSPDDPLVGAPRDIDDFNYALAATWNRLAPDLWRVVLREYARRYPDRPPPRVCAVPEWQLRGLVHLHILVEGRSVAADLARIAETARLPIPARYGPEELGATHVEWGSSDLRRVADRGPGDPIGARAVVAYLTKYIGKAVSDPIGPTFGWATGGRRAPLPKGSIVLHLANFRAAATWLALSEGKALWVQRRIGAALGYGGHAVRPSRSWGITFDLLAARRRAYARSRSDRPPIARWEVAGDAPAATTTRDRWEPPPDNTVAMIAAMQAAAARPRSPSQRAT